MKQTEVTSDGPSDGIDGKRKCNYMWLSRKHLLSPVSARKVGVLPDPGCRIKIPDTRFRSEIPSRFGKIFKPKKIGRLPLFILKKKTNRHK